MGERAKETAELYNWNINIRAKNSLGEERSYVWWFEIQKERREATFGGSKYEKPAKTGDTFRLVFNYRPRA